jgi:hypothetical protein
MAQLFLNMIIWNKNDSAGQVRFNMQLAPSVREKSESLFRS